MLPSALRLYKHGWKLACHCIFSINWLVIECHDVSPGKASFPSWLQVFIDTPPFVFRLSLTPPGRALPCASGEHIWALSVVEAGAGGRTRRQKGLQRALKELTIQSRPLEECWSKLPNPNNVSNQQKAQHKSGLLTWRRTWLIGTFLTPWKKRVIKVVATKKNPFRRF